MADASMQPCGESDGARGAARSFFATRPLEVRVSRRQGVCQVAQRLLETGARWVDQPCADLTDTGPPRSDASVDLRQDASLHNQPDIDPGRRAAEVQDRQRV